MGDVPGGSSNASCTHTLARVTVECMVTIPKWTDGKAVDGGSTRLLSFGWGRGRPIGQLPLLLAVGLKQICGGG